MASDLEYDVLDDVGAISGWEAADFDDLLGRGRQLGASKAPIKCGTKQKTDKTLSNFSSGAALSPLRKAPQQQHEMTALSPEKMRQAANEALEKKEPASVLRKPKRKQHREQRDTQHQESTKPSPRTVSILEENAAIAAFGRHRRMKVVAAAMAANVPRKQGIASVVSACFDGSDDEEAESSLPRRQSNELLPSSAPQNQQEKLPCVVERSTAPARPIAASKKINPPLPLPLPSINSNARGNEMRLPGKDKPASQASRHWRRYRKQDNSLLPSRGASENWEANFPPNLRRFRSPREFQAGLSDASSGIVSSSFTRNAQAPPLPPQDTEQKSKELLPSINHVSTELQHTTLTDFAVDSPNCDDAKQAYQRGAEEKEDDESWTHSYEDPKLIKKSMTGLIQALSTFAADGKRTRASKVGKVRKRRATLRVHEQQSVPLSPPMLQLPLDGEGNITHSADVQQGQTSDSKRKHRKLRNKQSNDISKHEQFQE
ncbi:unnamed protein product [Phytophthora fragariaefolia]|uniref:Unnamed protein product n=1 Tax=Phytophthora fragariaefolia TaxID=1490495 RepID=A0A9W6TJ37_9STRA|nr:unnamed protein product [Phytophthora fragariaefolia]